MEGVCKCNFCDEAISRTMCIADTTMGYCTPCKTWSMLSGYKNGKYLYHEEYFKKNYLSREKTRKKYFEHLLGKFPALVSDGDKVFDIGCGTGLFLQVLRERANITIGGIDYSPDAVRLTRQRLNVDEDKIRLGDVRKINLPKMDLVTMIDVLAHVEDAGGYLRHIIQNILGQNGLLFIKTPYKPTELLLLAKYLEKIVGSIAKGLIHIPAQIHHFTPESLKRILEREGMEIQEIKFVDEARTRNGFSFKTNGYRFIQAIIRTIHLFRTKQSLCLIARKR